MEKSTIGILVASGVSAFATFVIAISTVSFHCWTRKQRSPTPVLINSWVRYHKSKNSPVIVKIRLANPGEVPIQLRHVIVKLVPQDVENHSYLQIPDFIPPRDFADIQAYVPRDHLPLSSNWNAPRWVYVHLQVEYISGQRIGETCFCNVARIAKFAGDILGSQDYYELRRRSQRKRKLVWWRRQPAR